MSPEEEPDPFYECHGVGYDDGDIRGEWKNRPQVIIPKIGEVALLLGLEIEPQSPPTL